MGLSPPPISCDLHQSDGAGKVVERGAGCPRRFDIVCCQFSWPGAAFHPPPPPHQIGGRRIDSRQSLLVVEELFAGVVVDTRLGPLVGAGNISEVENPLLNIQITQVAGMNQHD